MALIITMKDQPQIIEYCDIMDNVLNAMALSFILSQV